MSATENTAGKQSSTRGPEGLRALDRAVTILYTLSAHPTGISLAALSRETGLTMPTVHRMLGALRAKGLARETSEGLHAVGIGSLLLSASFLDGVELRREARPFLESLNIETSETCHLGALASPHIVYIEKMDSPHPVRMFSQVGAAMPVVSTAMGKSMLAVSSAETVEKVLRETVDQLHVEVDEPALRRQLEIDRRRGFSTDLEENERGICCVGAPIFDSVGRVVAAVSVSTPTDRFDHSRLDEFGALLRGAADDISAALGYLTPARAAALRAATRGI